MTGRHLHLMGIGGVGMCGLAEVLAADGAVVTGCDLAASERTERLESRGVEVAIGHDPAHLDGAEALVVSAAVLVMAATVLIILGPFVLAFIYADFMS